MELKQRFFIYDRKEVGVLLLLALMVAIFAFTLGVHLGKRVGPHGLVTSSGEVDTVPTVADKIPNRQELNDQAKGAQQAADETLNQALHDEVARTGIKLDTPRQTQLPEKPQSENAGATTGSVPIERASAHGAIEKRPLPLTPEQLEGAEKPQAEGETVATQRPVPAGKYTIQIGSYLLAAEAQEQAESLEALGLKPFMRPVLVKGKQWFRVCVGGFNSLEAAETLGQQYRSQHMIEGFVVSKKVD